MTKPALTHDEKKAAEAAFQKEPFNAAWSEAAREVYDGISAAMLKAELAPREKEPETDEQTELAGVA